MNSTANNQTTITVSTTAAKPQANDSAIKKSVIYDRLGRAHTVEKVRGIQI